MYNINKILYTSIVKVDDFVYITTYKYLELYMLIKLNNVSII